MDRSPTLARLFYLLLLCLCATLLLAGCGSTASLPSTIPEPHGRGVTKVPGLEHLLEPFRGLEISVLGTYAAPALPTSTPVSTSGGSATPTRSKTQIHIVVQLGRDDGIVHSTDYYDIGIDGSDPHPLHFQVPCVDFLSITQDGRWGVCLTHQGIATFRVLPGFPSATLPEEHVILPIDSQFGYGDLSWDPTGRYLAIARLSLSDAPTAPLDIFAVSPQHDQARLVVRISGAFALSSAQWSPDGKWLAIDTMTTAHSTAQGYVIPLWQSVSPLPAFDAPAEFITLTMAQLVKAPYGSLWRSGYPAMLTEITNSGRVSQYEVATGHTQVIGDMAFPPESYEIAGICATTWTMDSRYLIFALCVPGGGDYLGLPPKLFVYDAMSA